MAKHDAPLVTQAPGSWGCPQLSLGKSLEFTGKQGQRDRRGQPSQGWPWGVQEEGGPRQSWALLAGSEEAQRGGDSTCQERCVQPVYVWQRTAGGHEHAEGALP